MYKWNDELLLDMISIHIDMFSWKVTLRPIPRFLELIPWLFFVFVFDHWDSRIPDKFGHGGDATWMMWFSWWRVLFTLQETNISHLGKMKIIFKYALSVGIC